MTSIQIPFQNVTVFRHGKKNVNLIPCQVLLVRKKLIFLIQGILARLPCPNLSRQTVSREKKLWLTKIVTVLPEDQLEVYTSIWLKIIDANLHKMGKTISIFLDKEETDSDGSFPLNFVNK